jgi:chromosome segregation ATPase
MGSSAHCALTDQGTRGQEPAQGKGVDYQRKLEELEKKVKALKLDLTRAKRKLEAKTEQMLDLRTELQQSNKAMEMAERESDEKDELLEIAQKDTEQYRNWWLNEIQFMKLMLNKIPEPNRDIELARASQAHYLGHF